MFKISDNKLVTLKNKQMTIDPKKNYESTREEMGYVDLNKSNQAVYDRIGFKSGLEVHQQLLTEKKLFCRCPAGIYQDEDDFDAEIIRHMRPTLSELGEYDGTALMEFKTRKNIIYRIKNETACTYEIDDTPPFPINRQALEISIIISLACKLNIVGELHITRKQYLDGSIPTGFQRTAIVGVEGVINLPHKDIRIIQLSVEEDSCREVSDIGHWRIYRTDRLGMPLIETVTYPDMVNPQEVKMACDYIRFINRSTGLVRTGIGAARQDVNVSCRGGTRVEIKGVSHTKWIPELTHNECFRQWALLHIREKLLKRIPNHKNWKITYKECSFDNFSHKLIRQWQNLKYKIYAVNLPGFAGILSHFLQPHNITFSDEISDRLKVIACIEKPNMTTSESLEMWLSETEISQIRNDLNAEPLDAQIVFWGPQEDINTALETIEERCQLAFVGVPNETRKSFENGTTMFERVLPGPDRMYPDTDSPPIPLDDQYINELAKKVPEELIQRYQKLRKWNIPEHYDTYIFSKNLFPLIEKIITELPFPPRWIARLFAQDLRKLERSITRNPYFKHEQIYELLKFMKERNIHFHLSPKLLKILYTYPQMDFNSILLTEGYKPIEPNEIISKIPFLKHKYQKRRASHATKDKVNWIMGQIHKLAVGNINLADLANIVYEQVES